MPSRQIPNELTPLCRIHERYGRFGHGSLSFLIPDDAAHEYRAYVNSVIEHDKVRVHASVYAAFSVGQIQRRTFLSPPEGYRKFFRVRTMYDPSHWSVCFEIPMELFFGGAAGYPKVMHGNFYKCRGGTSKHYACWNAVDTDAQLLRLVRNRPALPYSGQKRRPPGGAGGRKHYACWNAVDTDAPDFHRPEFFGTLCLL